MVELEQQKQLLEAKAATLEQTTQQLTEVEHDLAKERDQGRLVSTELAVTKRLLEKAQEAVVQLREEVGGGLWEKRGEGGRRGAAWETGRASMGERRGAVGRNIGTSNNTNNGTCSNASNDTSSNTSSCKSYAGSLSSL